VIHKNEIQLKYNSYIFSNPMYELYAPPLYMEKELTNPSLQHVGTFNHT
jgi:hypothetical protein